VSLNAASRHWPNGEEAACLAQKMPSLAARAGPPPGDFESFVEACDRATTAREVERLFIGTARLNGIERVVLTTHAPPAELGRLGVCAHNCSAAVIEHLYDGPPDRFNPLFEHAERGDDPIYWSAPAFRARLDPDQSLWMEQLSALGMRDGVSQRIRTAIAPASCSMTSAWGRYDPADVRRVVRMAGYALNTIMAVRRSPAAAPDLLTRRERQCLSLAVFSGLRPREVADTLGLSINTVRSIRQSATARLGARSQEETVWRLMESGQLFHRGRFNRPRSR
jgi:DNA-binding CsgD family transcriptional regulator